MVLMKNFGVLDEKYGNKSNGFCLQPFEGRTQACTIRRAEFTRANPF